MYNSILGFSKTIITAVIFILLILGGLIISLQILKDEAIKTHLKIVSLNVNTFSEQIYQVFNYIDLTTDTLTEPLYDNDQKQLNTKFKVILANTSYIRSINILDDTKKVIYSSNGANLNTVIKLEEYYPKPLFDNSILRFGLYHYGRDLFDKSGEKSLSYLPLLKEVSINNKSYYVLIVINSDYFTNRYIDSLKQYNASLQIIRFDGKLIYTSNHENGFEQTKLFKESINKSFSSGVELINESEYLSAYQLTDIYPLNISIKMDQEKSLKEWESKRKKIILLITSLVSFIIFLIFLMIYRNNKQKNKQIFIHKRQIEDQKKFKTLFEQDIFLSAILNKDGSIDDMNHLGENFLGKSLKELKDVKFYELDCWSIEQKDEVKKLIIEQNAWIDFRKEITVFDSMRNEHTIEFILKSINTQKGDFKIFALGLDITEKKEKEEKLQHAYVVYNNTHDGIMITDKDANIIDVNDTFIKNTGYSFAEIYGKNPRVLKSGMIDDNVYKEMWKDILEKGFWRGELINKDKYGNLFDEVLTVNVVYDEDKNVKNYIGIFTNITKQKGQERKLKEQEHLLFQQSKMAAMGEMLENIAHQWRQPLSVISMSASGIKLKKQFGVVDDSYINEALEGIIKSTKHLSSTIDDFRNFFKPNKQKNEVTIESVIHRTLTIVSSKFKNREIEVVKDIEEIKLYIFDNELVQVIMNIFKNSQDILEKLPDNERYIFIKAKKQDDKMILKIKDSGGGIKDDIIHKVFEPYFTTKHQSQGTGIGLYMSEEIITKHMKGKIYAQNVEYRYLDREFKGAQFIIEIPLDN